MFIYNLVVVLIIKGAICKMDYNVQKTAKCKLVQCSTVKKNVFNLQ